MNDQIPIAGTSGHLITRSIRTTLTSKERVKMMEGRGCPINRRIPTVMSNESLKEACKVHQEHANVNGENEIRCKMDLVGFRQNNWHVCIKCEIRKKIDRGEEFEPPEGITIIDLAEGCRDVAPKTFKRKQKKKKNARNSKITEEQVVLIRKLISQGTAISKIRDKIGNVVGLKTLYNIKNGTSWSHIK